MVIRNFEIDNETLKGLNTVSESQGDKRNNPDNSNNTPDPKYLIISLMTGFDKIGDGTPAFKTVPNPTRYDIDELQKDKNESTTKFIKDQLREHCKKFGTINEIVISGHGSSGEMESRDGKYNINTAGILFAIDSLEQELGIKIADRIVYAGCSTFAELENNTISYYRNFAKKHKMEIVGTTSWQNAGSIGESLSYQMGRYVQFTSDGEIKRDKLDTPHNPLLLVGDDKSWADFFIGHSQDEGVEFRKQNQLQQKNEQKAAAKRQEWENKCADAGPKI